MKGMAHHKGFGVLLICIVHKEAFLSKFICHITRAPTPFGYSDMSFPIAPPRSLPVTPLLSGMRLACLTLAGLTLMSNVQNAATAIATIARSEAEATLLVVPTGTPSARTGVCDPRDPQV